MNEQIRRALPAPAGQKARGIVVPVQKNRFRPEHIPQWLLEPWFAVLFTAPSTQALCKAYRFRRFAAVQLVQISTGMTLQEAARFLGIPEHWYRGDHCGRATGHRSASPTGN
ncbi:hypothetical protein [Streptomyces sp. NPDC056190]|uniref:hypothetical protein n=1 Tax=unclassified Streptomyces TaxID=2593676 RepID=UPI0035D72BE3